MPDKDYKKIKLSHEVENKIPDSINNNGDYSIDTSFDSEVPDTSEIIASEDFEDFEKEKETIVKSTVSTVLVESTQSFGGVPLDIYKEKWREPFSNTTTKFYGPLSLRNSKWKLCKGIIEAYEKRGIKAMYKWQADCLSAKGVLDGGNLVYTAPTSAGKTFVAEILILNRLLQFPSCKAIMIFPFVSIVNEKLRVYKKMLEGSGLRIAPFHGTIHQVAEWHEFDIALCTIEKANSLINYAISEGKMNEIVSVVGDEIHMLSDPNRGYLVELIFTKILNFKSNIQIIGMTATLRNTNILSDWLNAEFFQCNFRPVPLFEYFVVDNKVHFLNGSLDRTLQVYSSSKRCKDPCSNAIVTLAMEALANNQSVLVFCNSRKACTDIAFLIGTFAQHLPANEEILNKRKDLVSSLLSTPGGLDSELEKLVGIGLGIDHAGMINQEKELIEEAFDSGVLKLLCSTTALAAGINLPAKRVIFNSPKKGMSYLNLADFKQMSGRAGRKGYDSTGESYLCFYRNELPIITEMLQSDLPSVESCLKGEKVGLKRILLEIAASNLATSSETMKEFTEKTLFYSTSTKEEFDKSFKTSLDYLIEKELLLENKEAQTLLGSKVGKAIVEAGLSPEDGLFIYVELQKALKSFVLEDDLHIIYLVTPTYSKVNVNWIVYQNEYNGLSETSITVAKSLGINYSLISKLARGGFVSDKMLNSDEMNIHHRFYCALMLRELINEGPIVQLSERFEVERGFLQSLAVSSSSFASMVGTFCQKMNWSSLGILLKHFKERLFFGVRANLLELARLPYVKSYTARRFFESGYTTVSSIASIKDYTVLLPVLASSRFKRRNMPPDVIKRQAALDRNRAKKIIKAAIDIVERDKKERELLNYGEHEK